MKPELQSHPVRLTEAEKVLFGSRLATAERDRVKLKIEAKNVAADFKDKIKKKTEEISQIADDIANGHEVRRVLCAFQMDYAGSQVLTFRTDTGAQVDSRPMTYAEMNRPLFPEGELLESKDVADEAEPANDDAQDHDAPADEAPNVTGEPNVTDTANGTGKRRKTKRDGVESVTLRAGAESVTLTHKGDNVPNEKEVAL